MPLRKASRAMVDLLWLAHEHACEAELAVELDRILKVGGLPDLDDLRGRFAQKMEADHPDVPIHIPNAAVYDGLLPEWGATA